MDPKKLYFDDRHKDMCAYCGQDGFTRDHVPSKILLDLPYPDLLPVVSACEACNLGHSLDEEYFACFLECVICGSTDPERLDRANIRRIIGDKPALTSRILEARRTESNGDLIWQGDGARIQKILLKLARGHAAYECSEPQLEDPVFFKQIPLFSMTFEERVEFENPPPSKLYPEIGSRAFVRELGEPKTDEAPWIEIQPGRYRYAVTQPHGVNVRIVLSDYLSCEVEWE